MRALAIAALGLVACSTPASVRVQIGLSANAAAAAAGPTTLDIYTSRGRVAQKVLNGTLPGDVVVLVDNGVGEVRAFASVTTFQAAGTVMAVSGREVTLTLTLDAGPLPDSDGDGVPDVIDDCVGMSDPMQNGACASDDMSMQTFDLSGDLAMSQPMDLSTGLCGNGVIDPGEACDSGASNSDDPANAAATCTSQCKKRAVCGAVTGASMAKIDPSSGHCYVVWPTAVAWASGERDCLTRGGHLAAITSKAEDDFIKAIVAAPSWIGVMSAPPAASVVWSNGESNAYTDFAAGGQGMGTTACVVESAGGAGWVDRECSWPAQGGLPPSTVNNAGYVCEHACGNGVLEPGEECDPPTSGSCNIACRKIRACTETGGMNSPSSGSCYFRTAATTTYANALNACPAGTHLATPNAPLETETAIKVINADSWIALEAPVTLNTFTYDGTTPPTLQLTRYHGFATPDPDQVAAPQCIVISYMHAGGDGWRDRACDAATLYQAICERD